MADGLGELFWSEAGCRVIIHVRTGRNDQVVILKAGLRGIAGLLKNHIVLVGMDRYNRPLNEVYIEFVINRL